MAQDNDFLAAATDALTKSESGMAQTALAEPERPPPQPAAPAVAPAQQQQAPVDDATFMAAASDALDQVSRLPEGPGGPPLAISLPSQVSGIFGKEALTDVGRLFGFGAQVGSAALRTTEAPNLEGLSVDQVKAARVQMQQDLDTYNRHIDALMSAAKPNDNQLFLASQRASSLEGRIKEADAIIASGQPSGVPSPPTAPVHAALRNAASNITPATTDFLNRVFPTSQDYANSTIGQIAQFGADGLVMGAAGALLGPVGEIGAVASIMGDQTYQEARKAGADQDTAENASLLVGLIGGTAMPVLGAGVNALARNFAGMSAKEGMNALIKAMPFATRTAGGAAGMVGIGFWQDAVAKLTGYDPNRKMGATWWQNAITGLVFGAWHGLTADDARTSAVNNQGPNPKVRSGPATPTETPTVPAAAAPEVRPAAPTAPAVTAVPGDTRTAQQKFDDFAAQATGEKEPSFTLGEAPEARPPVYTGPPRPTTERGKWGKWYDSLTEEEQHAVGWWISNGPELREFQIREHEPGYAQSMPYVARIVHSFEEAMEKAPTVSGPVYRGINGLTPDVIEKLSKPNAVLENPSHSSTSADAGIAANFARINPKDLFYNAGRPDAQQVLMEFYGEHQGINPEGIGGIGFGEGGHHPEQKEVLLPKGATYRVREFQENRYGPYQHHVVLDQIPEQRAAATPEQAAQVLSLGAPSTETLERQGEQPAPAKEAEKPAAAAPEAAHAVPPQVEALGPEAAARFQRMAPEDQAQYLAHLENVRQSYAPETGAIAAPTEKVPAWYEGEDFAAKRPVAAELPPDRPLTPTDVKREVQDAQEKMGMHDNLAYTPTVDDLPRHVLDGMTPQERSTAQVVTDRKLGNVHVIGDRFNSLNELRRAIIEETIPYRYRNVSQVGMKHDAFDNDLGKYDLIADRPVLNTHALLRSDDPYGNALKSAMEEVNVHQGISRLLGPREGVRYVNGMNDVQAQFNRLQLNDILAQQKGFKNAEEMAAAYNAPNWRTDPKQAHKMTEELIGAYAQTFKTPEQLGANAPEWYQLALRNMATGIRRFLGLRVNPYDVQSLINDSAAALRSPKWALPSTYHPIGDAAKREMADFQYANRPPSAPGEEGAAKPEETADVGTAMVRGRLAELERALQPGQQLRTQPIRLAMQKTRGIQERLNLLKDWPAVIDHEGHREIMQSVMDMFHQDFGSDPSKAMDFIMNSKLDGARNPALMEVTSRAATDQINQLRADGRNTEADLLAARLDRANQLQADDTTEAARQTAAQVLRHKDGASNVAQHRKAIRDAQNDIIETRPEARDGMNKGKDQVDTVTKDAANTLRQRNGDALNRIATRFGTTMSLPEQYLQDLVGRIHDAMFKTNTGFRAQDTPALQSVYDTFRKNIQQIINERIPTEKPPPVPKPAATDTLRTILDNHSYYKEAWGRTMDMLYSQNPELAQRFARAIEEPVGETLANKLASEQGTNLSDLIYNHFSTNDRISTDLANAIINQTGIRGDIAQATALHLQNVFSDIVRNEQAARLKSIIDSVGKAKATPPGMLGRLVNHIVIGGLDSAEWRNLVAPKFGITHFTPEQIQALRSAGDYMSYLRDLGLSNTSIAQQVRQQMGDIMKLSEGTGLERSKTMDSLRYISDVYASSLLTGPLTHAPYWQQNLMTQLVNQFTHGFRAMAATKGEANREIATGMAVRMMDGYARGIHEFAPILRRGIRPADEFMPERGDQPMYRGSLEGTQIKPTDVGSWFANYKYVRNFLDAVSNLMVRGPQYATHHAMAMKLAWEDGLRGQDAWDAAERTVLGTPDQRAKALTESHNIVDHINSIYPDHPIGEAYRKMLEGELLDQYKTTSQNPDSMFSDEASQKLPDVGRRAMASSMRGVLRGDVGGAWGKVSRGALDFMGDYPGLRMIAPFLKTPFNLVNERLAWGPLGVWRSAADLVPSDTPVLGGLIHATPGLRGGMRSYLKDVPGAKDLSKDAIRDYAWEQMVKGSIGSAAGASLYAATRMLLQNPNAPVRFTYSGPSNYGQQEIERGKGWQPKSVYIGGAWHSYENTPWASVFAGLGALSDYFRYEKQNPDIGMNELAAHYHMMAGIASSIFGSPLQGPEAALQMLTGMAGTGGVERNFVNFASQVIAAGATIPFGGTAVRQLSRMIDPTQYEATTPWGKLLRYTPVVNAWTGEPKLNVFGEHMQASPLHNIPEYASKVDPNDPVWNWLDQHPGLHLSMPGNSASVAGIKMTPDEIYQYHLARGPKLKEELSRAMNDPHFNELPEDRQNYLIKHVYEHVASLAGARAVMDYRQQHPVTPEREAASLKTRGIVPEVTAEPAQ